MIAISVYINNKCIKRNFIDRKYLNEISNEVFLSTFNNSYETNDFNEFFNKPNLSEEEKTNLMKNFIIKNDFNDYSENNSNSFKIFHVGFKNNQFFDFPLYFNSDIQWVYHRINTIKELNSISEECGIEFDVRDSENDIIVQHDPFSSSEKTIFNDFIKNIKNNFLIINVKSEGIEEKIMSLLKGKNKENFFFLDCSFPIINKYSKQGIKNFALRYSEFEGMDTLINMKGLVDWVWIDCFSKFVLNYNTYIKIRELGYKICIVGPDLQQRPDDISIYSSYMRRNNIFVDMICTKKHNIDKWFNHKISKIYYPFDFFENKIIELIELDQRDIHSRPLNIYKLNNVELCGITKEYPNVILKSNNNYILPIYEKFMSLNRGTIYEMNNNQYIIKNELYKNIKIIEEPVLYFIYNTENYYHFLYDSVPYLYYYKELRKKGINVKLLINEIKYKFVKETFELLNIETIVYKPGDYFKTVYIGHSMTHGGMSDLPPRKEINEIYSLMIKEASKNYKNDSINEFYISRRTWVHNDLSNIGTNYTTRRKLMNEDLLVEELNKKGINEVFCENMSMIEKINLFSNAKLIIGAIGGGMCNLLFSNKDTKVICIVSPTFLDINSRFVYSMNHTNIKYIYDSSLYGNNKISMYTRVQIIDNLSNYFGLNGEIIEITDKGYKIKVGTETTTGWNNSNDYPIIEVEEKHLKLQDKGLNSPWTVNINEIIKELRIINF